MSIIATNYTNFYATDHELQEMFLFAYAVAGKSSKVTQEKINNLLEDIEVDQAEEFCPDEIKRMGPLEYLMFIEHEPFLEMIKDHKLGKYSCWLKMWRWFQHLKQSWFVSVHAGNLLSSDDAINRWLRKGTISMLEEIPGVSFKTSRFFILHSRFNAECVPLDTHILKFLRDKGIPCVPKVTPSSKRKYDELEKLAVGALKTLGYSTLAKADLETWKKYSGNVDEYEQADSDRIDEEQDSQIRSELESVMGEM